MIIKDKPSKFETMRYRENTETWLVMGGWSQQKKKNHRTRKREFKLISFACFILFFYIFLFPRSIGRLSEQCIMYTLYMYCPLVLVALHHKNSYFAFKFLVWSIYLDNIPIPSSFFPSTYSKFYSFSFIYLSIHPSIHSIQFNSYIVDSMWILKKKKQNKTKTNL